MLSGFKCLHSVSWGVASESCIYILQKKDFFVFVQGPFSPRHHPLLHIQATSASSWRWWQYLSGMGDIKGLVGDPPSVTEHDPGITTSAPSAHQRPDQCQTMGKRDCLCSVLIVHTQQTKQGWIRQILNLLDNDFKATISSRQSERWPICCTIYPTVGYMVVPVCSVQMVGLYKSCGCICDITISTALYPPLFMSVGYLQQHLHPLYM